MGKLKSLVSLKHSYIYKANDMEPKENDNGCSHLSENSLIGDKILAEKRNGCPHGNKDNRKAKNKHEGVKDDDLLHLRRFVLSSELFKGYPADKGNIGRNERQHTGRYK